MDADAGGLQICLVQCQQSMTRDLWEATFLRIEHCVLPRLGDLKPVGQGVA